MGGQGGEDKEGKAKRKERRSRKGLEAGEWKQGVQAVVWQGGRVYILAFNFAK
jgi:hypothetical protein